MDSEEPVTATFVCLLPARFSGRRLPRRKLTGSLPIPAVQPSPAPKSKPPKPTPVLVRTTTSAADGSYVLTNLPIGPYTLEVSKDGFTKYVQSGIVLQVDTNPTIDAALKVGSVSEQVTVEAGAALVETHSTGIGTVVDNAARRGAALERARLHPAYFSVRHGHRQAPCPASELPGRQHFGRGRTGQRDYLSAGWGQAQRREQQS